MQNFYSEQLNEAIRLLYFQTDASLYPKAIPLLEQATANAEPDAFYVLARCYGWGDSGMKDSKENDRKALELSGRGAELGSCLAILGADRFGRLGAIKPQMKMTHEEACAGAIRMAEAGNPLAMYAVGLVYFWGDINRLPAYRLATPEENALESLKWFDRAAEQGFVPGFRNGYLSRRKGENHVPIEQIKKDWEHIDFSDSEEWDCTESDMCYEGFTPSDDYQYSVTITKMLVQ